MMMPFVSFHVCCYDILFFYHLWRTEEWERRRGAFRLDGGMECYDADVHAILYSILFFPSFFADVDVSLSFPFIFIFASHITTITGQVAQKVSVLLHKIS